MDRLRIPVLCLVTLLAPLVARLGESRKGRPDFSREVNAAVKAFEGKHYGACVHHLRRAEIRATLLRRKRVRESLPDLGAGYTVADNTGYEDTAKSGTGIYQPIDLGETIERAYTSREKTLRITLTLDTPAARTLATMIGRMGGKNAVVIDYVENKALLETKAENDYRLTMVLGKTHRLVVDTTNISEETLRRIFSQENVNRISKAVTD